MKMSNRNTANKKKIVALIPLRGGSKSIPRKNIEIIAGKHLCAWVLEAVERVDEIDEIYVSTDDDEISKVVESLELNVKIIKRPSEFATDEASTESVMLHFAEHVDFDVLVTLQATSPLTSPEDIKEGLKLFFSQELNSLLTGVRSKRFFWNDDYAPINYDYRKRPRRQDFKGEIMENGAFYITDRNTLIKKECRLGGKIGVLEMPPDTSFEIDEPGDWEIAELLLIKRRKKEFNNSKIKLFVADVDGTLTDAGMYYSKKGEELKKFNTRDAKGLDIMKQNGVSVALITTENSEIVLARAKKLGISDVYIGIKDKLQCLQELCSKLDIKLKNVAYIGDDINDLSCLSSAGFSACPSDASEEIKKVADYVCKNRGGEGAVREVANLLTP